MSLLAVLDALEAAGVDASTVLAAVRAHEARRVAEDDARRAKAAAKKRRQRAEMSPDVPGTNGDNEGQAGTVGDIEGQPLSLPPSPQTPQPPTHTRVSITTREADAREDAAFGRFWAEYPRKTAKAEARKAFGKAWRKLPADDGEAILLGALVCARAAWTDAQFIPHAATWLNGERWTDEPLPLPEPRIANDQRRQAPSAATAAREDRLRRSLAGLMAAVDEREPDLGGRRSGTGG